jgi:hypothetical protein
MQKIASLTDGTTGFDSTTRLKPMSAKQYLAKGYNFVIRYIGRGDGSRTFVDITQEEAQAIVDAGLDLYVVQHPMAEGWSPTTERAGSLGLPALILRVKPGCHWA